MSQFTEFESISKSNYIDNKLTADISRSETKLEIRDYSKLILKNISRAICSTGVKVKMDYYGKISDVFNQDTSYQEIALPSKSDCEVKEETVYCESCPYTDVDLGRLKSHTFLEHPTEAAFVINNFGGKLGLHNVHNVKFFCVKEACSFSTSLYNVYEEHLMHCCPLYQTLSGIEKERLMSAIRFVLDFHKKHHLATMSGFLDYVSVFNKIYMSEIDQDKICEPLLLENDSVSYLSFIESSSNSDVKPPMSYNEITRNSEYLTLSVPTPVMLVAKQNGYLRTFTDQRDLICSEGDENIEQLFLIETAPNAASSEGNIISNIRSSFDNPIANDVAVEPLYNNNTSSSEDTIKEMIDPKDKPFKCADCHKSFDKNSSLIIHIMSHTGEKVSNCNAYECGETFSQNSSNSFLPLKKRQSLILHQECREGFNQGGNPITHLRTRTDEETFKFTCNKCGGTFGDRSCLAVHNLRTHSEEKPFLCHECGKTFDHRSTFVQHSRKHTGEKPFKCNECGKTFSHRGNLTQHLRTHTGEKPFKCPKCDSRFGDRSTLTKHLRIHSRENPLFICRECGKSFSDRITLAIHLRTHPGKNQFQCNECYKSFGHKSRLIAHSRTHTGEKPFKCNECGKRFSHKSSVSAHLTTHTGEKPFKCHECGTRFGYRATLSNHLRRHTEKKDQSSAINAVKGFVTNEGL